MSIDTSVRDMLDKQEQAIANLLLAIKEKDARVAELELQVKRLLEAVPSAGQVAK